MPLNQVDTQVNCKIGLTSAGLHESSVLGCFALPTNNTKELMLTS